MQGERTMTSLCRLIAVGCSLASFCADAQVGGSPREIVLPSPQLIHCRWVECSQLWKKDSGDTAAYPAQVLTDFVDGEVVGLTAVYDKSVSALEIQSAIDKLYGKWKVPVHGDILRLWRVEPEQLAIQLADQKGGTKQVIYLKFGIDSSLVPSAHIDPTK